VSPAVELRVEFDLARPSSGADGTQPPQSWRSWRQGAGAGIAVLALMRDSISLNFALWPWPR